MPTTVPRRPGTPATTQAPAVNGNGQAPRKRVLTPIDLHPQLSFAQVSAPTAGAMTPLVRWTVPDRVAWLIREGDNPLLKLYDQAGAEIPGSGRIVLARALPGDPIPQPFAQIDYAHFRVLTIDAQDDQQRNSYIRLRIAGGGVRLPEASRLEFWVDSNPAVDLTRPETVLALRVLEERVSF